MHLIIAFLLGTNWRVKSCFRTHFIIDNDLSKTQNECLFSDVNIDVVTIERTHFFRFVSFLLVIHIKMKIISNDEGKKEHQLNASI